MSDFFDESAAAAARSCFSTPSPDVPIDESMDVKLHGNEEDIDRLTLEYMSTRRYYQKIFHAPPPAVESAAVRAGEYHGEIVELVAKLLVGEDMDDRLLKHRFDSFLEAAVEHIERSAATHDSDISRAEELLYGIHHRRPHKVKFQNILYETNGEASENSPEN